MSIDGRSCRVYMTPVIIYLRTTVNASFLSGSLTYGEFFTEQEAISEANEEQIARIEQRREYTARQQRTSIEAACSAAGGRWNGWRCEAELGDTNRKISCTTTGETSTCNVP